MGIGRKLQLRWPRAAGRYSPIVSRFLHDSSGSTAIEFAKLIIPFALLVFAILETCISFAGQQVISNATDKVARQLRTGQIKVADLTETKLRALICDQIEVIVATGCPGLEVDLRSRPTFAQLAALPLPLKGAGQEMEIDTQDIKFEPGLSMSKNMLRVLYPWPVMTDIMREKMSNLKGYKTLLFATATWQNEPFDD
jgi:Flp pilus assembly protein TadG